MKPDYKISSLADFDMRQYEFIRNSRLPRGTFDDDPWWRPSPDACVFWAVVVGGIVALVFGAAP
jgi:hypothetical protein